MAIAIVLAATLCGLWIAAPAGAAIDHAAEVDPVELALIRTINQVRADRGMGRLEPSIALQRAADRQSYYILNHDWFAHDSKNGVSFAVRVREYVKAHRLGETLAWSADSASSSLGRQIATRWLRSSSHRAELLNASYTRIGVARRGGKLGSVHANVFTADFASG
jgi:uncharacterized protein YkwD